MEIPASNRIIQGLWVNGKLSNIQLLCIQSFLQNGHSFHLYTYNQSINAPEGVEILPASEIFPESSIFKDDRGTLGAFSDIFRFELLYQKGGWWVDMDEICLKPFDFKEEYVFSSEHNLDFSQKINVGVIKVPPESAVMQFCRDASRKLFEVNYPHIKWGSLGSHLLESYIKSNDIYLDYVMQPEVFCPVPFVYFKLLFNNIVFDFSRETYGVHLWNEMLRLENMDINGGYHKQSCFERLKNTYL